MRYISSRGARTIRAISLALLVGVLAVNLAAQKSSDASKSTAAQPVATQANEASNFDPSAGQKVFIDPVTHKIVQPTAEDIKALENAAPKKTTSVTTQPKAFVNPRGGIAVKLDDSFMSYAVAGKDDGGKLKTNCIESDSAAKDAVKSGKVATSKTSAKEVLDEK